MIAPVTAPAAPPITAPPATLPPLAPATMAPAPAPSAPPVAAYCCVFEQAPAAMRLSPKSAAAAALPAVPIISVSIEAVRTSRAQPGLGQRRRRDARSRTGLVAPPRCDR